MRITDPIITDALFAAVREEPTPIPYVSLNLNECPSSGFLGQQAA
jgi:hypothetical protein